MISIYASFFFAALLGSWHCAAMCGPLACNMTSKIKTFYYHLGRLISYLGMGFTAGYLGEKFKMTSLIGFKTFFLILLIGTLLILTLNENILFKYLPSKVSLVLNRLFKLTTKWPLLFGFASVLMPCAWLYTFIGAAATTQAPVSGLIVMFLFWLAGLPALLGVSQLIRTPLSQLHLRERQIARFVVLGAGLYSLFAHYIH